MLNKFLDTLYSVLRKDIRLIAEDGSLLKNKACTLAMQIDQQLIKLLLENENTKKHFFTEVDSVLVFDKIKFGWVINNREFLPDSYTRYKNKIGLVDGNGENISNSKDVVLVWPYKDCYLEGGQTKEDQKRDEVFYNETLAPDEVDRLLYPKVFTNVKKYMKDREEIVDTISENDNLLIKGNNLLTISSLMKRYENCIKCVYIDVPYNTGNDSFGYNDRFNHSTWLTFIKNRLEIAHKLLKKDGTIAISVDNYELAYMLVLLDEIFGKNNRKNIITVKRGSVTGAKVINPGVVNVVEYVVLYSKDSDYWKPNRVYSSRDYDDRYGTYILNYELGCEKWEFTTVLEKFAEQTGVKKSQLKKYFGTEYKMKLEEFVVSNAERIARLAALDDNSISSEALAAKQKSLANPNEIFYFQRADANDYYIINGNILLFAKDRMMEVDGKLTFGQPITDIWDDVLPNDLHNEGGVELKKGKKPEKLIARIIDLCTNHKDIILDFFAGSGTTGAVAQKMNRQYILCEQMDYIQTTTKQRLVNVINGENRGVSQSENWQGGGSFIYCELKELNQQYVTKVQDAKNEEDLMTVWTEIANTGFISHYVRPSDVDTSAKEFSELSFENKKRLFLELIDKNMLYVNLCDIDDEKFAVSDADKAFNRSFYGRD